MATTITINGSIYNVPYDDNGFYYWSEEERAARATALGKVMYAEKDEQEEDQEASEAAYSFWR